MGVSTRLVVARYIVALPYVQWIFDVSDTNVLAITVAYCESSLSRINFWPKSTLLSRDMHNLISLIASMSLNVISLSLIILGIYLA